MLSVRGVGSEPYTSPGALQVCKPDRQRHESPDIKEEKINKIRRKNVTLKRYESRNCQAPLRSEGPLNPHSADSVTSDGGMLEGICVNQKEFPYAWHPVREGWASLTNVLISHSPYNTFTTGT